MAYSAQDSTVEYCTMSINSSAVYHVNWWLYCDWLLQLQNCVSHCHCHCYCHLPLNYVWCCKQTNKNAVVKTNPSERRWQSWIFNPLKTGHVTEESVGNWCYIPSKRFLSLSVYKSDEEKRPTDILSPLGSGPWNLGNIHGFSEIKVN